MSKISTDDFYYCVVVYVTDIKNKKVHCNKNIRYTLAYKDDEYEDIYFDVKDFKPIKLLKPNNLNINEWYIISATKLYLNNRRFHKEYLRKIIKKSLPELENDINKIESSIQKIIKK